MARLTTPVDPVDVFPRMSNTALWRASVRTLVYFLIALPAACAVIGAFLGPVEMNGASVLVDLFMFAFFGVIFGAIPMAVGFLLATLIQRSLNRTVHRGLHRVAAGALAGCMAGGAAALPLPAYAFPGCSVPVAIVAAGAAVAGWEITRRHLDRDIVRYGIRQSTPEGAP
ncbi:hypothetical protein [Microbacterium sp. ZW T5_56]|uniref:hypothetical protein n=1 Tax=Microbacterium sp. ZW T5_56 TaxID=3378081 RepID=UPI00385413E3